MVGKHRHITSKCFINAPFWKLQDGLLELFLENQLQPEIGLEGDVLYHYDKPEFEKISLAFQKAGLSCTLHAPFLNLDPGSHEARIRKHSWEKLKLAFELITIFKPISIVCHPHLIEDDDSERHIERLQFAEKFWPYFIDYAAQHQTPVMFENTYEKLPNSHKKLLTSLNSPYAKFCLDAGHVMAFAKNHWCDWLPTMEPWLGHLHLHDNKGNDDEHIAIGKGSFDFKGLFQYLKERNIKPLITLEPHKEEDLWESLSALNELGYFSEE